MRFSPLSGGLLLAGVFGCQLGDHGSRAGDREKLQQDVVQSQDSHAQDDPTNAQTDPAFPDSSQDEAIASSNPQEGGTSKDTGVVEPVPEYDTNIATKPPVQQDPCLGIDKSEGGISTIEQAIALINQLPKPVTVACVLKALQRPLHLVPTKSRLSAQPAFDEYSPRIFIFSGSLTISVVPAGEGSKVIEFGYQTSEATSIKGELPFPVTETLSADAAYRHILADSGKHTLCGPCHRDETAAPEISSLAFISQSFRPHPREHLPFESLEQEGARCQDKSDTRCEILNAIFSYGEVIYQEFPETMPTIF